MLATIPFKKMPVCAIFTSYVKLFKTSYLRYRSESGVGVYQFFQIKSHTGAGVNAFESGAD